MPILRKPRLEPTVFLYTDRVDELARFYAKTLGFSIKRSEPNHSYWLDTGAVTLVLHQSEREYMEGPYDPASDSTLLWFHIRGPIRTAYNRVRQAGILTTGEVEDQLRNGLLVIRDVQGRRIGLIGSESPLHKP